MSKGMLSPTAATRTPLVDDGAAVAPLEPTPAPVPAAPAAFGSAPKQPRLRGKARLGETVDLPLFATDPAALADDVPTNGDVGDQPPADAKPAEQAASSAAGDEAAAAAIPDAASAPPATAGSTSAATAASAGASSATTGLIVGGVLVGGLVVGAAVSGGGSPRASAAPTPTNRAPTAAADVAAATEDGAVASGSVATNDSDPDGDALTFTLNAPVAGLTLAANGGYTFDPANAAYQGLKAGETRAVVANYTVSDGKGGTATSTLTITVTGTNDVPVATAAIASATEDGATVTGQLVASDVDGDTLRFALAAPVAGLTVNANGSYSFDPSNAAYQNLKAGQTRTVVATYNVTDGQGGTAASTLTITVTGVNDSPVATAASAAAIEDGAVVTGQLVASDVDGDPLAYSLAAPVAGLTLNASGSYSFDPANAAYQNLKAGETRVVVANYVVTDGQGGSATSTLTITVTGTNDAPIATAATAAATEDGPLVTGQLAATDVDGDPLAYTLTAPVAGLTLNANGGYSFDPSNAAYQNLKAGETRSVVANYTVSDSQGGTAGSTLTITVTGTNDAPVATAAARTATEDGPVLTGQLAATDIDGDPLTFALAAPIAGLTLNANGSYSFDPSNATYQSLKAGQARAVVANYTVSDGQGGTATSTLTITVTGTNDAPVATAATAAATEDGPVVTGQLAATDVDGDPLTYTLAAPVAGLTLNANGSYSFDPSNAAYQNLKAGQTRTVTGNYSVADGQGGTAASTLTITVTGTNDAPVAVADSYTLAEDTTLVVAAAGGLLVNDSDVDGDALTAVLVSGPANGTLALNPNGSFSYTPNANYNGADSFTYRANDGTTGGNAVTVTLVVTPVNDAPTVTFTATAGAFAATEQVALDLKGKVTVDDVDAGSGTISVTLGVGYGLLAIAPGTSGASVTGSGTGSVTITGTLAQVRALLGADATSVATFTANTDTPPLNATLTVTVNDQGNSGAGGPLSVTASQVIAITPINDAPIANAATASATEDGAIVTGQLVASDVEGDTLSFTLDAPVPGLTLTSTGGYSFDPSNAAYQNLKLGETRAVVASYTVADGNGGTANSTLTITVTGINDVPVATATTTGAAADGPAITGQLAATDVDGDTLTYTLNAPVAGLTVNSNGSYTFDGTNPAYQDVKQGQTRTIIANYTVADGQGGTATSTLTINLVGTNDDPVANPATNSATEDGPLVTGQLIATDVDGDTLTYTLNAPVAGLTVNANGSYSFNPADAAYQSLKAGETRNVVANYTVSDGFGGTATSTLTITVTGVNDLPVANAATNTAIEDGPTVTGQLAATDVDGDPLTYALNAPVAGLTLNATGGYSFDPSNGAYQNLKAGETRNVVANYTVSDGRGGTATSTLTITVTGVNDLPVANAATNTATEDGPLVTGQLVATDVDGDPLTYTLNAPVAGLSVNANGSYSFDPSSVAYQNLKAGETRNVVANYTVSDGRGGTATSTLTITVTGVNDVPVAAADSYTTAEDTALIVPAVTGLLANDTDADGDLLTANLVTGPAHGTLTLNSNGSFTYTPTTNYNGSDSFTYRASDGTASSAPVTVSLNVTAVNDAPTVSFGPGSSTTTGQTPLNLKNRVAVADVDAGAGMVSVALAVDYGNLTVSAGTSGASVSGSGTGNVTVSGTLAQVQALLTTDPNSVVSYAALSNRPPASANLSVTINDNGNTGAGGALSATANQTLTLVPTNAAPAAVGETFNAISNTTLVVGAVGGTTGLQSTVAGSVLVNDSDPDGDAFSISAVGGTAVNGAASVTIASASGGTVTMVTSGANAGSFSYLSAQGYQGSDSFTYTVRDVGPDGIAGNGDDLSSTATVTLRVGSYTDASGTYTNGRVWYVDAAAAAGGTGSSVNPFNTVTATNLGGAAGAGDLDGAGDYIYVRGAASGNLPLEASQHLIGAGSALVVGGVTLASATDRSLSSLTSASGATVTLSTGNEVAGLNLLGSGTATGLTGAGFGTLTINNVAVNTAGQALSLNTGTVAGSGLVSTTSAGGTSNVALTSVAGTLNLGTGTLSGASGVAFAVNGGAGNVDYDGSVQKTSDGIVVQVQNKTGGTVQFDGAINGSGASDGASLTGNTGTTINFNGGVNLNTAASNSAAFTATGGGTVSVVGGGNVLNSGAGTALNVQNTTIGANGLTFQSISANGAANGIILASTGTAAGLNVTGTGSAGSGGTITNSVNDGITLNGTTNLRLNWMNLTNNLGDGIGGTTVNGFVLNNSTISGNGNDVSTDESGINIRELSGTGASGSNPTGIFNSTITNNHEFEVQITNTSGTLTNFQVVNSTISSNNVNGPHGNLVNFLGQGTSTMGLTVTGSNFTGNAPGTGAGIFANSGGTAMTVNVSGSTFTNNNIGIDVSTDPAATTLNFNIANNTFTGSRSSAINHFDDANGPFTRTVNGIIAGNTIGSTAANSGSLFGNGIAIQNEGAVNANILIENNIIRNIQFAPGIAANVGLVGQATGGGTTNLTIRGNQLSNIGSRAITVQDNQDTTGSSPFPTINLSLSGNAFGSGIAGQGGNGQYLLLGRSNGTFNVTQQQATNAANAAQLDDANGFNDPTGTTFIATTGTIVYGRPAPTVPAPNTLPLMAASTSAFAASDTGHPAIDILSQTDLNLIVAAAIDRWAAAGATDEQLSAMRAITFGVAALDGQHLGTAAPGHVTIDDDAAGFGWFIDTTPDDDVEFAFSGDHLQAASNGAAAGRMDLLSAVVHELGHQIGLDDHYDPSASSDIMHGLLETGERKLPSFEPHQGSASEGVSALSSVDTGHGSATLDSLLAAFAGPGSTADGVHTAAASVSAVGEVFHPTPIMPDMSLMPVDHYLV